MTQQSKGIAAALLERRTALGLSESECARRCGLSEESYCDTESYDDEFFDNISLGTARRIAGTLGLDWLAIARQHLPLDGAVNPIDDVSRLFRHDLVSRTREGLKMTIAQLADAIGYEESAIEFVERTPEFIEALPARVVTELALALGLRPSDLLG